MFTPKHIHFQDLNISHSEPTEPFYHYKISFIITRFLCCKNKTFVSLKNQAQECKSRMYICSKIQGTVPSFKSYSISGS